MPRNRLNPSTKAPKEEPLVAATTVADSATVEKSGEKPAVHNSIPETPAEKPKPPYKPGASYCRVPALILYRKLYSLRATLRVIDPKIAKTTDRILASIGYPARLIFYFTQIAQLKQLSNAISDYRTFSRVISTPATLEYALDLLLDNKNPDRLDRYAEYLQAIAGLMYQILEDLAFLADKRVIRISPKRQADLWVVSSMFWAADVATELLKIPYHHYILHKEISCRKLAVNLAWLPLTYHWSTYTGVFDDGWVGLLGTAACWPNMVFQWKNA